MASLDSRGESPEVTMILFCCFLVVVELEPFRSAQTIAGIWDPRYGVTVGLGEMDNRHRPGET